MREVGHVRAVRLPKAERRRQLLETAMHIVREEGADCLTLGHLATRAGVSKPVIYEHFPARSDLLIQLYRWIDTERVAAFRLMMAGGRRSREETVATLAETFVACATDDGGEFNAVGAALSGSSEKAAVYQELLDNVVDMFDAVLGPVCRLPDAERRRTCIALVGAGEALAAAVLRDACSRGEATKTLVELIDAST